MNKEPIFVLGRNRSGTKWLSNMLSNHSALASIQRDGAGGIVEVNELSDPYLFGDLRIAENKLAFLAFFEKTNYFKISAMAIRELHEIKFDTLHGFFGGFMDRVVEAAGKRRWLQKSNTLALPGLLSSFSNAKFILIRRKNVADNLRSHIAMHWAANGNLKKQLFRRVFSYMMHWKFLQHFSTDPRILVISYEELKANPESVLRGVCKFTELEYEDQLCTQVYRPNSSFSGPITRDEILNRWDRFMIRFYTVLFRTFPFCVYKLMSSRLVGTLRSPVGRRLYHLHTFSIWSKSDK